MELVSSLSMTDLLQDNYTLAADHKQDHKQIKVVLMRKL